MSRSIEWCAGFFEGEGNFRLNASKNGKYLCYHLQIAQVHKEPLEAFLTCFNKGVINGPYGPYTTQKFPYYAYCAYGEDAKEVGILMLPFLFKKKDQIQLAIQNYEEWKNSE